MGRAGVDLFIEDGAYTTLSSAVVILVVLTLLFSSTAAIWSMSRAGDTQVAADSGALAGANVVSSYHTAATVVDASILSLGLADEDFMKRLNKVIFQAFFPILMFNNLYSIPEGMTLNLRLVAVAIISVLFLQAVLLAVVPRLVKENERRGVIIQAIYRSNFVLFGIPLATSVFGEEGTLLATMMVAIVIPVYNITAVVILELFRGGKVPVFVLIKNILKNPMIRGALMGFIFHMLGIKLPVSVEGPIKQFANLTTPLALFVLGGTLHFNAIGGNLKYVVPSMTVKMVILPAVILAVATLLGFSGVERFVYFEMYATPVATASYAMAQNMGGDGELAGQFVVLSTVASVVTIFLWVYFLNSIGWLA